MSLVRRNVAANLIGSGWVALMSFAFIPFYIHFMGIESYGLVGFFMSLQAVLFLMDLGLTATVSRELARLSVEGDADDRMRTLVRTLEVVYWGISTVILVAAILLSHWLANEWLQVEALPKDKVAEAILLMGFVIAARMPFGFYSGGLMGLQHQVLANVVKALVETVRNGGAVLVLWLLSPEITAFFLWQAVVSVIATYVMRRCLWRIVPECSISPVFSIGVLQKLWRFAIGMSGIALVSVLLMQMDKIVLSRMLPLDVFGYYTVASVIAMALFFLTNPIVAAYAPKLTQLVKVEDRKELVRRYHQGSQLMAVMIFPVAIVISVFSSEVLFIWTQNSTVADVGHQVLSILIIGTALNGAMNLPYALQIAYGWTRLAFLLNLLLLALLFPLLIIMTQKYGIVGAAAVWLILNVIYVLAGIHIMHLRLIPGEKWKWYLHDVLYPCLASLAVVVSGRFIFPDETPPVVMFFYLLIIGFLSFLAAVIAAPLAREKLFSFIKHRCFS